MPHIETIGKLELTVGNIFIAKDILFNRSPAGKDLQRVSLQWDHLKG